MDGFEQNEVHTTNSISSFDMFTTLSICKYRFLQGIILMAATNLPDILDPALTRPGRFDRHVSSLRIYKELFIYCFHLTSSIFSNLLIAVDLFSRLLFKIQM